MLSDRSWTRGWEREPRYVHCRGGSIALIVPDYVRETYQPRLQSGGHDDGERGIRYLEWAVPADPGAMQTAADFVYILRDHTSEVRILHDRHFFGLFPRQTWIDALADAGFAPTSVPDVFGCELFVGRRP